MQGAEISAAARRDESETLIVKAEPHKLRKRIGSTTIEVSVYFSETAKETYEDKILRLMEREVRNNA
ncbi:hypothetical protein FACS1894167_05740 [Synergistales bacterium]|nr:hypothetical protein FACS1894167_05740 [Synergistales bacterium]